MRYPIPSRRTPAEAAIYLRISTGTLANWRMIGKGPRFYRAGRNIFYQDEDLDAFIQEGSERAV